MEKELPRIKGPDLSLFPDVSELLSSYSGIGFQATHLSLAKEIIDRMYLDDATIFLSFTSNMVSSGLREIFAQLLEKKKVDCIVTTAGSIEEDFMKSFSDFHLGDFDLPDQKLKEVGMNRIGNILVDNGSYVMLEERLRPILEAILKKEKEEGKLISPSDFILELGKNIEDKNSILYWAKENDIPIFCPGITDGALGLQFFYFKEKNPEFGIDVTGDMKKLSEIVFSKEKTAGIILGGSLPKHHLIGSNLEKGGLDYAVYISTGTEGDGSLSGARPKEAKSWGKIKAEAKTVYVESDATLVFPLIAKYMLSKERV